jgi:DNA-binding beta-propeller fold protein YncE
MTTTNNNTPETTPATPETPAISAESAPLNELDLVEDEIDDDKEENKRRMLLLLLVLLLLCLCCVAGVFFRYLNKPEPLPQILPPEVTGVRCYAPVFRFNITNVDGPLGIAVSADNQRVYVTEFAGERLIKMFDRDGNLINSFSPPGTGTGDRSPGYVALDADGRVFVVDRLSNTIQIYTPDGEFIDAIMAQDMTISKFLAQKNIPLDGTTIIKYDFRNMQIYYSLEGQNPQVVKVDFVSEKPWGPMGVRFDKNGNLIYTDTSIGEHSVRIIPAAALKDFVNFAPEITGFGVQGKDSDQFDFPQVAVLDSRGNYYISDGNNYRITSWTPDGKYRQFFGFGAAASALNLPRGAWMDPRDCLLVVDSVGSKIQVYDVSGDEAQFSYSIGDFGITEGLFVYPNDVFIDGTGRLYITDRENNRIQVWSY